MSRKCYNDKINVLEIDRGIFLTKKQIWFELAEDETIEQCLERMKQQGYVPIARKEEPVFHIINNEPTYLRQKVQFKGALIEE